MRVFVIDDDPGRHRHFARWFREQELVAVRTVDEAMDALDRGPAFDVAFLDHDLNGFGQTSVMPGLYGGQTELTGADVAMFIRNLPRFRRPQRVIIHSWNPPGALGMLHALEGHVDAVSLSPFDPTRHPLG